MVERAARDLPPRLTATRGDRFPRLPVARERTPLTSAVSGPCAPRRGRARARPRAAPWPAATMSCCGPGAGGIPRRVQTRDRRATRAVDHEMPVVVAVDLDRAEEVERRVPLRPHESALDRDARAIDQAHGRHGAAVALEVVDAAPLDGIPDAASSASSTVSTTSAPLVKTVRRSVHRAMSRARAARSGVSPMRASAPVLQLPRVARGAAEERHAVEGAEAGDRRKRLAQAGGDDERAGCHGRRCAGAHGPAVPR